ASPHQTSAGCARESPPAAALEAYTVQAGFHCEDSSPMGCLARFFTLSSRTRPRLAFGVR
ncbi:MAG TPA: hypothetical protein VME43_07795, partial [Bryobacteraceae bacterium]|nr:hypothetical protein [Bryobacteraceae bacterium]